MSRSTGERDSTKSRGRPEGLPKRWSAQRKAEVVLRLLRGEDIGEVSRELRVAPPELERWRREFLEGGKEGLKKRNRPGGELMRTRAKLGEMTMRVPVAPAPSVRRVLTRGLRLVAAAAKRLSASSISASDDRRSRTGT